MAIALNQFLNQMSTDQLRTTNMYEVYVTSGYDDVDKVLEPITMYSEGISLPSRTQEFADAGFKGFLVPVPTVMRMEQDHTMTIRADTSGEIRRAFLAWAGHVADPNITDGSVFSGDRRLNNAATIRVHLLDNDMKSVAEVYKFIGVKIASVGGLQVSNTDASISTFDVQFKSIYWEIEKSAYGAFVGQK